MKEMLKNRKLVIIVIAVIVVALLTGVLLFTKGLNKKETSKPTKQKEETYTMYVKINPLVKLIFKEEYKICYDDDNKEYACSYIGTEIIGYELVNDDAKTIYNELDFTGKSLYDVLLMLCETARNNKIGFESLEITTDSSNINEKDIMDYLKENSKLETDYTVYVNFEEHIDEKKILKNENIKAYTITFDTDGGSEVKSQTVSVGNKVIKPVNPTKNGYTFVEWQLNGKTYDFNTEVTSDITLKAKWKKETTSNNQSNNNSSTNKEDKELKTVNMSTISELITLKNLSSNVSVTFDKYINITVAITGEKALLDKIPLQDLGKFNLYVDLTSIKTGTHNLKIQIENANSNFTYKIEPDTITISASSLSSTINKINLNDNLLVAEGYSGTACGHYFFSTNAQTVFGSLLSNNRISLEDFYKFSDQVIYDSSSEQNAFNQLESLKNGKNIGVSFYNLSFGENKLGYSYYYLYFSENYGDLANSLNNYVKSFSTKISSILNGGIFAWGMCGDIGTGPTLLTEELCDEYNLTCARW